jgi:hypothetical protein
MQRGRRTFSRGRLAWVPFMMQRFDNEYMMRPSETPAQKLAPVA